MIRTDDLTALEAEAQADLAAVGDLADLAEWKSRYTGKSGALTHALRSMGSVPAEQRPERGRRVNALRELLDAAFEAAEARLKLAAQDAELAADRIDVTMPGHAPALGHLHLTTQVLR